MLGIIGVGMCEWHAWYFDFVIDNEGDALKGIKFIQVIIDNDVDSSFGISFKPAFVESVSVEVTFRGGDSQG